MLDRQGSVVTCCAVVVVVVCLHRGRDRGSSRDYRRDYDSRDRWVGVAYGANSDLASLHRTWRSTLRCCSLSLMCGTVLAA